MVLEETNKTDKVLVDWESGERDGGVKKLYWLSAKGVLD